MQWIADIIKIKLASYLQGKIFLWSGAIGNIPIGWALCDGTRGTPDLSGRFIIGSGSLYSPGDNGNGQPHDHDFRLQGFWHRYLGGDDIGSDAEFANKTETHDFVGVTNAVTRLAPTYILAFIMKL